MISKSAAAFFKKQSSSATKYASLTVAHQRNFAGGGPKKPAMPASETEFDIVFVGILIINLNNMYRWNECYSPP